MPRKLVLVTIPAYNEEKTLGKVIEDIKQVMDKQEYDYKVIVVDDGSEDKTVEVAKNAGATIFSHPMNYGLGETFRTEIKKCLQFNPDIIVHTDADGQYLAKQIPELIKEIENGNDLVLGSRFKGTIEEMPLVKRWGNRAFSRAISHITRFKVSDAQTGFRAFTREIAEKIEIKSSHTYTQEQIIKSVKHKYKVKEIPIHFAKRDGKSRLISNPFGYAARAWVNIFRIYRDYDPLKTFGMMGLVPLIAGIGIGSWLLSFFFDTGRMPFTGSLILTFLLVTIGIAVILFGFLADMRKD